MPPSLRLLRIVSKRYACICKQRIIVYDMNMKKIYKTASSVSRIDMAELYENGKRFIIIDLDNTIARWKTFIIKDSVSEWLKKACEKNFEICILSNNHNSKRTVRIAELLGIKYFAASRKKPSRKAYCEVLRYLQATAEQTVMIGDQLFSDIRGAAKVGIDGILVDPIYKREAFITKLMRIGERMAGRKITWQDN